MDDPIQVLEEGADLAAYAQLVHSGDVEEGQAEAAELASDGLAQAVDDAQQPGYQFAGLGVDIVEVDRVKGVMERAPHFAEKVFTVDERAYCERHARPERHYAARFAAKEAVAKALGTGFVGFAPHDIEVVVGEKGRPDVVLAGRAQQVAAETGVIAVHLSISHTSELAIANAVAVTQDALPQRDDRESAQERLMRAFKDVRGVLDGLDAQTDAGKAEATGEGQAASDDATGIQARVFDTR